MTGYPEHNYQAFHDAEFILSDLGHSPLNPALNFNGSEDLPYDWYIREDLKLMSFADGIAFLPEWQNSRGAMLECHVALVLGMDMYLIRPETGALHSIPDPEYWKEILSENCYFG